MSVVYSLDWDWFTGVARLVECDHALCGWKCRSEPCQSLDGVRPSRTDGVSLWRDARKRVSLFLSSVHLRRGSPLFVAESHASILKVLGPGDVLLDWDFHCDEEPLTPGINCGSWRLYAARRGVRLLDKHQPSMRRLRRPDKLFLCLSSPWTPSEYDPLFYRFVLALQNHGAQIRFIGHRARQLRQRYILAGGSALMYP